MGITSISVFTYCRIVPCNCGGRTASAVGEGLRPQTRGRQERGPRRAKRSITGQRGGSLARGTRCVPTLDHESVRGSGLRCDGGGEAGGLRGRGGRDSHVGRFPCPPVDGAPPTLAHVPPCACVLQDTMSWGRGCRWGPGRARASRRPSCVPRPHSNQRGPQGPPTARWPVRRTGDNWPYDDVCLGWGGGRSGGGEAKLPGRQGRAEPACRTPSWRLRMVWRGRSPT